MVRKAKPEQIAYPKAAPESQKARRALERREQHKAWFAIPRQGKLSLAQVKAKYGDVTAYYAELYWCYRNAAENAKRGFYKPFFRLACYAIEFAAGIHPCSKSECHDIIDAVLDMRCDDIALENRFVRHDGYHGFWIRTQYQRDVGDLIDEMQGYTEGKGQYIETTWGNTSIAIPIARKMARGVDDMDIVLAEVNHG